MKLRNLALVFMCIASVSCVKQKLESTYNSQENRIDQYIEKNRRILAVKSLYKVHSKYRK